MKIGVRPVERAFQLARSGSVRDIAELKKVLEREGYFSREIEGKAITGQLRESSRRPGARSSRSQGRSDAVQHRDELLLVSWTGSWLTPPFVRTQPG